MGQVYAHARTLGDLICLDRADANSMKKVDAVATLALLSGQRMQDRQGGRLSAWHSNRASASPQALNLRANAALRLLGARHSAWAPLKYTKDVAAKKIPSA